MADANDSPDAADTPPNVPPDRDAQPVDAEPPPQLPFVVVGVGASAGGLEAFGEFLRAMRPDSGMAFVFVLHLSPDRHSLVAQVLAHETQMPVLEVDDGMAVEPNHVYVIRPAHVLKLVQGRLKLGPRLDGPHAANRPVDDFFKSLAQEQRERAIAVILSGMGSNGTAGAQAIKAVGGMCIAQDPESAQFPSMPGHLINARYADFISRPAEMPELILQFVQQPYATELQSSAQHAVQNEHQHLREILAVLRTRTKYDFSGYKKPTVIRRIQRRMGLAQIVEMAEYCKLLRRNPTELSALADDLLIHVTGFFRDPDAWETLRTRIIVPLIASRESNSVVRCWVPACASGEEAYSLAMLLEEEAERTDKHLDIKVFATDMAERTLANARAGVYAGGIEAEISPARLARFFEKEHELYRVRQGLRERVIFAPQNLLQDPPFSRLDIVTCRNLLIYLVPAVQQRVVSLLHFGLREGGTLFLGSSETLAGNEDLFEPIDKKARIFRRIGPTRHGTTDFPFPHALRTGYGAGAVALAPERHWGDNAPYAQLIQRVLLEHHVPCAVLVDRDQRILHFQGNTGDFLEHPSGEPTRDLMSLAREGVGSAIRSALHRAAADNKSVTAMDGWLEVDPGKRDRVYVTASPVTDKGGGEYFVVSFNRRAEHDAPPEETAVDPTPGDHDLQRVRSELQSTIEELQRSNEELKAAHEEVVSINEELQSSNEELETSKEEMQSLNEELTTVNAQLRAKMEQHEAASTDLVSLLKSTDIAVLFLDPQFRIRRFTPAVRELFELIPSDLGRPLSDLARKFEDENLVRDGETVLEQLVPIEREVATQAGKWFLRRVTPYRTADQRIDGVVLAFVDITARKLAESALRDSERRLKGQKVAFEASINGAPLDVCLDILVRTVAGQASDGVRAAFYIVGEDRKRLHPISTAGGMPDAYLRLVDGYQIGDDSLACGLGVASKSPILTRDVLDDPKWAAWAQMARDFDFRACWSFPIQTDTGEPVGTFAMYHRQAREATDRDISLATAITQAAAILISRQTESKKLANSEQALEFSEKRQAFLLQLSDALRPLSEPNAIQEASTRILGQHMEVDRVGYGETDEHSEMITVTCNWARAGVSSVVGKYRIDDFGSFFFAPLREGRASAIEDAAVDSRIDPSVYESTWAAIGVRSAIAYPLVKQGRLVAAVFVHLTRPRRWTHDETRLVEEVAERTWAAVERARAEKALRESEERSRFLVEGAKDFAMLMLDPQGRIVAWNIGAERLLGYKADEVMGQDASRVFTLDGKTTEAFAEELAEAAASGRLEDERWYVHKNGTRFWGSGVLTALRTPDGALRNFVKVLRDESARKKLEDAETAALIAAEQANQAKDEFLSVLSHELRTPLSAILLWAKLLVDKEVPDPQQIKEGLFAIRASADAQKELIDDLLDVSRITSGNLRLQTRRIELSEVVLTAIDAVALSAQAKGVGLSIDVEEGPAYITADPDRIRQVVWNLLTNAVKFTPAKGSVTIILQRIGHEAEIRVSDTGRGITAQFLPHIFERFSQAEGASTRTHGGLGLGLSIAKQLVELHGGTIAAQSDGPDQGATFTVRLPLAEDTSRRRTGHRMGRGASQLDLSRLKGMTILLVEDDEMTRQALVNVLKNSGMHVLEAESAEAAIELFRSHPADALLSDIGLPEKDGYSLLREIRQSEAKSGGEPLPAIALTAFARDVDRSRATDAGFQEHLPKPVDAGRLVEAIYDILFKD